MNPQDDIIAAIATPIGEGGISVIRVSGKGSIELVDTCFRGKHALRTAATHTAHVGNIVDGSGDVIDEVIATVFREPHSYTAEDSVEVSCHGGIFVTRKVLGAILDAGARMAEPGEFTKRAFINGRIDLSRAEAVADVIRSQSENSLKVSISQLEGALSNKVSLLREKIIGACSLLELELDFSEEGIELRDKSTIAEEISLIANEVGRMMDSYTMGRIYREGVAVAFVGKPNVGKSSIFNALLNNRRAIVTAVPGTTRDTIEESLILDGLLFKFVDTAGLRPTLDIVEQEGIKLTERHLTESDLVVYIVDSVEGFNYADEEFFVSARDRDPGLLDRVLIAVNKMDLAGGDFALKTPSALTGMNKVLVSAKTGMGLDNLKNKLKLMAAPTGKAEGSYMVTNLRHQECLSEARSALLRATECLRSSQGNEVTAFELREAVHSLEKIIGAITTEEILNSIFSQFCIGK